MRGRQDKKSYTKKSLGRERANSWANPSFCVLLAPRVSRGHFFLAVFVRVTHDGPSERGTTRSLESTKFKTFYMLIDPNHLWQDVMKNQ